MYNSNSIDSILEYAKKLKGKSLKDACSSEINEIQYSGKGNFGQFLEKYYFGYEPNSSSEADFSKVGVELKSSPLKELKNGEFRAKERLVLNIINYLEVCNETFETSSFWKKNAHLLLVFYLYEKGIDVIDLIIKLVDEWKYSSQDLYIIRRDWEIINKKIKDGKAHELSEGDTFYLGACTKGSTAEKSLREQPFSTEKAKQRAYSLKQGYVNHIIASISKDENEIYGKIINLPEEIERIGSIEELVFKKFKNHFGKTDHEIVSHFSLVLNPKAKNFHSQITNAILGIELNKKIEEFEKADIIVKTIRLKENGMPKEHISFPTFKFLELVKEEWDESEFKNRLERKFFFVIYQYNSENLVLKNVKFWNMPSRDILEAKKVWEKTIEIVRNGNIVDSINSDGRRITNFPKATENTVSHVRPHARDSKDCYPLPVKDKVTGSPEYTKQCFWLNMKYVKENIIE